MLAQHRQRGALAAPAVKKVGQIEKARLHQLQLGFLGREQLAAGLGSDAEGIPQLLHLLLQRGTPAQQQASQLAEEHEGEEALPCVAVQQQQGQG
jgi:hypothetical protein